jgi:hypothetical protein
MGIMDNVINLAERRAANDEAELTAAQEAIINKVMQESELRSAMQSMVKEYVDSVYENCTVSLIEMYAKDAIELELRSIPFDAAVQMIKNEFPEIACKYQSILS